MHVAARQRALRAADAHLLRARERASSLPNFSVSIVSIRLLPASEVMPPFWNRPCRKFSAHMLPSATWYGSRKSRDGNE